VTDRSRIPPSLYPFADRFLDRGGLRLHYLDEGQGEPVVMLHGNPTWSFHFRALVLALRDRYRVVVPDHIGMGLSDKPSDGRYRYCLQSRADDLAALLDHLGLVRGVTLVVHDWGATIGMAWAARFPERVARLVLLNGAAFHVPSGAHVPAALHLVRNRVLGALALRSSDFFIRTAARTCCTRRPLPREVLEAYLAPYQSWADRIALLRFPQDVPLVASDPSYSLVSAVEAGLAQFRKTPTTICWGERDVVFPPCVLDVWRDHFPHAEVHRFPDCGHWVLEDAPDEIAACVRAFLAAPLPD
jgi:Predicted hydrolases or acyltransferases (alpha/beta hydrolase superfamily)